MGYIDTLSYRYLEETKTIEAIVDSVEEISEKPIIVTNHVSGGEQYFTFKSRTKEDVLFEDTDLKLLLRFINFSNNNNSEENG